MAAAPDSRSGEEPSAANPDVRTAAPINRLPVSRSPEEMNVRKSRVPTTVEESCSNESKRKRLESSFAFKIAPYLILHSASHPKPPCAPPPHPLPGYALISSRYLQKAICRASLFGPLSKRFLGSSGGIALFDLCYLDDNGGTPPPLLISFRSRQGPLRLPVGWAKAS